MVKIKKVNPKINSSGQQDLINIDEIQTNELPHSLVASVNNDVNQIVQESTQIVKNLICKLVCKLFRKT